MANTSVSTQALIDETKGTNFYEAAKAIEASANTYYEQIETNERIIFMTSIIMTR